MWKWGTKLVILLAIFMAGYTYGIRPPEEIPATNIGTTEFALNQQEPQQEYYCEVTLNEIECVANKPIKKQLVEKKQKVQIVEKIVKDSDTTYWENIPPGEISPIAVELISPLVCTTIITT